MLPPPPRGHRRPHPLRHEHLRNPNPRRKPRRNHEPPPFRTVRTYSAASSDEMHRRVRGLMTEDFLEERTRCVVEEPAREGDLGSRGAEAPERTAETRAGSKADAL